jgi:hypothetical protein
MLRFLIICFYGRHEKISFWILVLVVITQIACNSRNQNHWSQFRGEDAMGVAPENATPPVEFVTEKNVLWKIETPEGLSIRERIFSRDSP